MDEWSVLFTVAALLGVLLMLFGAWWIVRTMRARRPPPRIGEREDSPTSSRPR